MAMQLPVLKNKSGVRYLVIVLIFLSLAWGIYLFFEYRITQAERESKPGYQTTHHH